MDTCDARVVLITVPTDDQERWRQSLQQLSPNIQVEIHVGACAQHIPADLWRRAEVLFTLGNLPKREKAPRLRWVQLCSAGADRVFKHSLIQSEVVFTTSSGVQAVAAAEFVFATLLAWYHRFPAIRSWVERREWLPNEERQDGFRVEELRGKTLGIVGYGSIGREVARLAKAFGMHVLAQKLSSDHHDSGFILPGIGDPEGSIPDRYYSSEQFYELLGASDVVVASVPLTNKTCKLFDEAAFAAMKPTAFFANIARGGVCDEEALIRVLQKQQIAGAALDVFAQEPLAPDSPLWQLPNVFISPHVSGLTRSYSQRAYTIFAENLRRYLLGEQLYNIVDKERQY